MKRLVVLLFFVIALVFSFSCKNSGGKQDSKPTMFCLVNSSNWRTPDSKAILTENTIKVYGTSPNGQTIILNVLSSKVGEYALSSISGHNAEFIPNTSSGSSKYSTLVNSNSTGTIKISSINEETKTMSGSFFFTAYRENDNSSRTITDGVFSNVPYQFFSIDDSSSFQNTFSFNESGRIWHAKNITAQKNDTALIVFGDCDRTEAWQSITLWMSPTISAGVHYITSEGPVYARFQKGFYSFMPTNGSITIIENNSNTKKARGTFFFNYVNENEETLPVSDGQFEVKF